MVSWSAANEYFIGRKLDSPMMDSSNLWRRKSDALSTAGMQSCLWSYNSTAVLAPAIHLPIALPAPLTPAAHTQTTAVTKKPFTYGRCKMNLHRTSWCSRKWSPPTAGDTPPDGSRTPPYRWYWVLRAKPKTQFSASGEAFSVWPRNKTLGRLCWQSTSLANDSWGYFQKLYLEIYDSFTQAL